MPDVPSTQTAMILHGPKQDYKVDKNYPVPALLHESEILVENKAIGLNPIDWKAPDFNFGLPELPYIAGRELAGEIAQVSASEKYWKVGDRVVVISTDYRDIRKGAYQQYVVAQGHTVVRLPADIPFVAGSTFGVAFAATVLALGISLGVDFSHVRNGPDLYQAVRDINPSHLPEDVRSECLHGIKDHERPQPGDWLVIWGGSATSANIAIQLARLAGLRVAVVVDSAKHGLRLSNHPVIRPDILVDSHDPKRAIDILRSSTKGKVRFGLDTRGTVSASHLLDAVRPSDSTSQRDRDSLITPPGTPSRSRDFRSHLVGLSGLPKHNDCEEVLLHTVPIKLFHEVESIGKTLTDWAAKLLESRDIVPPDIVGMEYGLESINDGLNRMRNGEISGGRLVIQL